MGAQKGSSVSVGQYDILAFIAPCCISAAPALTQIPGAVQSVPGLNNKYIPASSTPGRVQHT